MVQDLFLTETSLKADVVLPGVASSEKRVFIQTQSAVYSTTKQSSHLQAMLDKIGGSFARSHVVWAQQRALTSTHQKKFGKKLENVTLDATAV